MKKAMILVFGLMFIGTISAGGGSGGSGWGYGYTALCDGTSEIMCQYSCTGYDDFSSDSLDLNKWEIRQDVEGQPLMDEYWLDNLSDNYHMQQNTIGDRRTYLFPKRTFTTGDILEYKFEVISKEGNYGQMVLLTGDQYIRVGIEGYVNGVQGFDELGEYKIKIEFQENNFHLERTSPSGVTLVDDLALTNSNGTYELYIGSFSGHNGRTHMDFDGFATCTKQEIPSLQCGDTITQDTVMTEDLIDCGEKGIVIGTNNIALDCGGHTIDGTRVFSTGVEIINKQGITLKNCVIKDFHWGVRAENSHNNFFDNNTVNHNEEGFSVLYSNNNLFENNEASSNIWEGFYVDGLNNTLLNNEANHNGVSGISIKGIGNRILTTIVNYNRWGIFLSSASSESTLEGNTVSNNNEIGLRVLDSINNIIWKNNFYVTGVADSNEELNTYCVDGVGNNYFDGATGAVCPVLDSDNDGVLDSEDKCSNTEGEQIVYGCSCEQILELKPGEDTATNRDGCSKGVIDVFTKAIGWAKDLF